MRRLLLYVMLVILPSACFLYGPTYRKPNVNLLTTWQSKDANTRLGQVKLPMLAWWKRFNDPVLTSLIEQSIANNNDIQVALGNMYAAKGQLLQIQFSWIPSVNALMLGYSATTTNLLTGGYNSGFILSYAFNLFQYMRSTEWAKAKLEVAKAAKDAVKLTIIGQTAAGYFTYLAQLLLHQQQKQLVDDLLYLLQLTQKQYEHGLISLYTLQQYKQDYEKAHADLPIIANNLVAARNTLQLLLNKNPGPLLTQSNIMKLNGSQIIPTNLPSQVLRNRPDIKVAEQALIAANANVGITTSIFFPNIILSGVGGASSTQLNQLFSSSKSFWHYQTYPSMPLIDPAYNGLIQQAQGQKYSAYHTYIQAIRTAFKSVDTDLSAHHEYLLSLKAQTKNYTSSQIAYNLAQKSYQRGLYSYPTLLVNKISLDKAAIDLTKSKLAELITIVQLYEDLGGGYDAYHCKERQ